MNFSKPRIKKHCCLWLTFKNDEALEHAIEHFAIKYDTPLFKPHISISKEHGFLTEREFKSLDGIARSFIQLSILGLILHPIFLLGMDMPWIVGLYVLFMILIATVSRELFSVVSCSS